MAQKEVVLSKAERILVEWAHNDYNAGVKSLQNVMQARLNAVAESHSVPEGSQVQFIKSDDGVNITLVYDAPEEVVEAGEVVGEIKRKFEVPDVVVDGGEGPE